MLGNGWDPATIYEPIDMNSDGSMDFTFSANAGISIGFRPKESNRYLIIPSPPPNIGGPVAAVTVGFDIGSDSGAGNLDWFGLSTSSSLLMLELSTGTAGNFWDTRGYIGVEFEAFDGLHYGWFDVKGHYAYPYVQVYGWAYESTPNTSIIAGAVPEPASAILFLIGVVGAWTLRKRKNR